MKKLLVLFMVISVFEICTGCSPSKTRKPIKNKVPAGNTKHSDLVFSAGDIIACDMDYDYAASHIFMATTNSEVIHITVDRDGGSPEKTPIVDEQFSYAANPYGYCKVITEFYDKEYASICGGKPFNISEIIKRADKSRTDFRAKVTHYHAFKCNCEHWVTAWRYGVAMTLQLPKLFYSKFKSDNCEAPGKASC